MLITGYYTKEQCHIDLGKLCSWSKARLILAEVNGVDKIDKKISFADGRPQMSYDLLSINIGITPMSFPGIQVNIHSIYLLMITRTDVTTTLSNR